MEPCFQIGVKCGKWSNENWLVNMRKRRERLRPPQSALHETSLRVSPQGNSAMRSAYGSPLQVRFSERAAYSFAKSRVAGGDAAFADCGAREPQQSKNFGGHSYVHSRKYRKCRLPLAVGVSVRDGILTMEYSKDWTQYDNYPEMTCECSACGHVFRSHASYILGLGLRSRKPCPECKKDQLRSARSDPEAF
jgi:hypothetical protein